MATSKQPGRPIGVKLLSTGYALVGGLNVIFALGVIADLVGGVDAFEAEQVVGVLYAVSMIVFLFLAMIAFVVAFFIWHMNLVGWIAGLLLSGLAVIGAILWGLRLEPLSIGIVGINVIVISYLIVRRDLFRGKDSVA